MPTIAELPLAAGVGATDEMPISQDGVTRAVTLVELLSGTQPLLTLASDTLLGRVSLGPGAPEQVGVGTGLGFQTGSLTATGGDHAGFAARTQMMATDGIILNASGIPMQMPLPLLRGLFSAGTNVSISGAGVVASSTDPSVTSAISTLSGKVAALSAEIPPGGAAALNAQGQMIDPVMADIGLGTVSALGGGEARTMRQRVADTLNLLDFGAVQGGADCTTALQAAFAALNGDGEIFLPAGDYWFASSVVLSGKAVAIRGAGRGHTRIHVSHTGIGFDLAPSSLLQRVTVRDMSFWAENAAAPSAAALRVTYPASNSCGYMTAEISDVDCYGYPNAVNGVAPFPQTFTRGIVLQGCWSARVGHLSFFGPPASAGATSAAAIEINGSFDTRIDSLMCYYGSAAVLQTGYAEGIYLVNPLVVGSDYVVRQTSEANWPGYQPDKPMLLGLWLHAGELNTNLGTLQLANVTIGFIIGCDISRDGGPNTSQTLMDFTDVSNVFVQGCNFVGGPSGGNATDVAFSFKSTWNSSSNNVSNCHFENLSTVIDIVGVNGTVDLTTGGLQFINVPLATAFIDGSNQAAGNLLSFISPASGTTPAAISRTQDHVFANGVGQVELQISNVAGATNHLRVQAAATGSAPVLSFEGGDGTVGGVIQTKGGSLTLSGGSAGILVLTNVTGAASSITMQNAATGAACVLGTSGGALTLQPKAALTLSAGAGVFMPGLPTSKPAAGSNQLWNNGGVLSVA